VRDAVGRDLRGGLLARQAWPAIALASALVVAGHAMTFLIAARTAGATASPSRMLPLALLVLPGAAVLVVDWVRRTPSAPWLEQPAGRVLRVPARPEAAPDA
jgi:hypothetical protein